MPAKKQKGQTPQGGYARHLASRAPAAGKSQAKPANKIPKTPPSDWLDSCAFPLYNGPSVGNFGVNLSDSDPSNIYLSRSGGNGSVTTKHELSLSVVDFFEYQSAVAGTGNVPQFVHNYFWDVNQNLFDTFPSQSGGADITFCRVRKVELWAMPQSRGQEVTAAAATVQARSNSQQMFTVNAQVPGVTLSRDATLDQTAYALNTQVTNVLPTINPKWKKVLTCDLQKTFQSGVSRPYFANGTPATFSNQCLFSFSITEPDTGAAYQTGSVEPEEISPGIKMKVRIIVDQPIATLNNAKFSVFKNEDFALPGVGQNGPSFLFSKESYAQMDLLRKQDLLR